MKITSSIAALLVVLSFSGAALAQTTSSAKSGKNGPSPYMEEALAKLPAQDAAKFRNTMKEAHEKNEAIADRIHSLHDEIDQIMVTDPFDKDAFLEKSKKLRDVYEEMRANTDEAFASAVADLPQGERKTLVAAMAYPHAKHKTSQDAQ